MLKKHGFHFRKFVPFSDNILKPGTLPLKAFKQKVNLKIERDRFIIKTAENQEDLAKVLRLRHDVFYEELLEKRLLLGIDMDKYDFKCDHLIIIDKRSDTFIGTYRLISTLFSKKFYSETEFKLDSILELEGTKLELGRACVHKDFRTGSTIALLWRGITEYMKETGAKYLFGCSSVMTTDKREIAAVYKYLSKDFLAPEKYRVYPKGKYKIRNFKDLVESITPEEVEKAASLVPTLVKSYINMGALICGEPAFDKKFRCADFFTLFNIDSSSDKVHRKYKL